MLVLGFDTETTGVDIKTASILEMGAVLFDVQGGKWTPKLALGFLIDQPENYPIPEGATKVNKLSEELLKRDGVRFIDAMSAISNMASQAEFVIAHNEPFDRGILKEQLVRMQLHSVVTDKNWLCSMSDLEDNEDKKCRKLSHISVDYGVVVDPSKLHRAVGDVLLMGQMLTAVSADPQKMWEYRTQPTVVLCRPTLPPWEDGGKDKEKASALGYRWEKAGEKTYPKKWVKMIKKNKLDSEPRPYVIVEEL